LRRNHIREDLSPIQNDRGSRIIAGRLNGQNQHKDPLETKKQRYQLSVISYE
jgi:hypothetical protein